MSAPGDDGVSSTMSMMGRLGAQVSWANTPDRSARTAPGRAAFDRRFEDEVDPDRTLDPADRAQRADAARKAYFTRLALKSARVRKGLPPDPEPRRPAIPVTIRRAVLRRDGVFCRYCGEVADPIVLDHVHPWSLGGKHLLDNLVVACGPCNSKKRARTLDGCGMTLRPSPDGEA